MGLENVLEVLKDKTDLEPLTTSRCGYVCCTSRNSFSAVGVLQMFVIKL